MIGNMTDYCGFVCGLFDPFRLYISVSTTLFQFLTPEMYLCLYLTVLFISTVKGQNSAVIYIIYIYIYPQLSAFKRCSTYA